MPPSIYTPPPELRASEFAVLLVRIPPDIVKVPPSIYTPPPSLDAVLLARIPPSASVKLPPLTYTRLLAELICMPSSVRLEVPNPVIVSFPPELTRNRLPVKPSRESVRSALFVVSVMFPLAMVSWLVIGKLALTMIVRSPKVLILFCNSSKFETVTVSALTTPTASTQTISRTAAAAIPRRSPASISGRTVPFTRVFSILHTPGRPERTLPSALHPLVGGNFLGERSISNFFRI